MLFNMDNQLPADPSRDRFCALVTNQINSESQPRRGTPKRAKTVQHRTDKKPKSFSGLLDLMHQRTAADIDSFASSMARNLFLLSPESIHTLMSFDLPEQTLHAVLSLNYMSKAIDQYDINDRLDVIATAPPSTPTQKPDWTQWWLDHTDTYIGISRTPDPERYDPDVIAALDQTVRAMAAEAAQHFPTLRQMAEHQTRNPFSATPSKKAAISVTLLDAWHHVDNFHQLGRQMLMSPAQLKPAWYPSPEELLHHLQLTGLNPHQDTGSLISIQDIRKHTDTIPLKHMEILVSSNIWLDHRNPRSYRIGPTRYGTATPGTQETKLSPPPDPNDAPGPKEQHLMLYTVPFHPALTDGFFNHEDPQAERIAWFSGTTPNQADDYLYHRTEDPGLPPGLTKCPLIDSCASHCARAQREDTIAYPFTLDGSHHSCAYMAFLSVHRNSTPDVRETAAEATIVSIAKGILQAGKPTTNQPSSSNAAPSTPHPEIQRPLQTALF